MVLLSKDGSRVFQEKKATFEEILRSVETLTKEFKVLVTVDDSALPEGQLIPVDFDTWNSLLDIRPVHEVGEGCCCDEGVGATEPLAWPSSDAQGLYLQRDLF